MVVSEAIEDAEGDAVGEGWLVGLLLPDGALERR